MSTAANPETEKKTEAPKKVKSLCVHIGDVGYAIALADVREIVGYHQITPVPGAPHWVRGVVNLRGRIIPVSDARLRFGMDARDLDDRTCIVILHVDGRSMGLIVDTVDDVQDLVIAEDSPDLEHDAEGFVAGMATVGKTIRVLLDSRAIMARGM